MPDLKTLRAEIDQTDQEILKSLARRMELVALVGQYKKQRGIPPLDQKRWQEVLSSKIELAQQLNLDPEMIEEIYESIHQAALKLEALV